MRQEFFFLLSKINKGDAILDVGPMEGAEIEELVAANDGHVTCMNLKGKTPVEGAAYVPAGSPSRLPAEGGEFDVVTCIHMLSFIGLGGFGMHDDELRFVPPEFSRVLQDDGKVILAVPVGMPNIHRLKEGMVHVFHRDEIVNLFSEFNLADEQYFVPGEEHEVDWLSFCESEGIVNRTVVQVGLFEFTKASVKPKAKDKKKKKSPPAKKKPPVVEIVDPPKGWHPDGILEEQAAELVEAEG